MSSSVVPRKERCVAPECSRRANLPESAYCGEECVCAYVQNALKLIEQEHARRAKVGTIIYSILWQYAVCLRLSNLLMGTIGLPCYLLVGA